MIEAEELMIVRGYLGHVQWQNNCGISQESIKCPASYSSADGHVLSGCALG